VDLETDLLAPQIIIVALPGRKRENLAAIAGSTTGARVQAVETCQEAANKMRLGETAMVLVDCRSACKEMQEEVTAICQQYPQVPVVLLQNRPGAWASFPPPNILSVLYDDISIAVLNQLAQKRE
jgi:hypothetical protein